MSTDPCMDAALDHVRKATPCQSEKWESIAKDLADAGSALVANLISGRPIPPLVMGLWHEAATAYDVAAADGANVVNETSKDLEP